MVLKVFARVCGLVTLSLVMFTLHAEAAALRPCPDDSCLQAAADCEYETCNGGPSHVICQYENCGGASCCYECYCD